MSEPHGGSASARLRDFVERYTGAWCSQDPARVGPFFAPDGGLSVNDGVPAVGLGTNTGPEGTGRRVRISGFEAWRLGAGGLIAESQGQFDSAEYQRQLQSGAGEGHE